MFKSQLFGTLFALLMLFGAGTLHAAPRSPAPLAGEWNGLASGDEIGFYDFQSASFNLCKQRFSTTTPLDCVQYPTPGWYTGEPLMGRWSALDTHARPALYDPSSGQIYLFSYSDCLPDQCFAFGGLSFSAVISTGLVNAVPVVGDRDGSGVDSIALLTTERLKRNGPLVTTARLLADGLLRIQQSFQVNFDRGSETVIAGDWPGTSRAGDSLGFYHRSNRVLRLYDGSTQVAALPVPFYPGDLQAVGGAWPLGPGFALYLPSNCQESLCHRPLYFFLSHSGQSLLLFQEPPLHPHVDPIFPDDPGGPGGGG
ncbi:MAG: hypothetical protein AAF725_27470 [Acidobacteriota bacterium]